MSVGSGGNRIVFTLLERNAGIDLVHLADGRMRLSINEWPDNVQNDSSPGRLVSGKWVCFRVSYDATREKDQVSWQFSEPMNEPIPSPKFVQDRRNTYNRGTLPPQIGADRDRELQLHHEQLRLGPPISWGDQNADHPRQPY
ncbi:MAG: hypothetical protein ACOX52_13635 [Verrucomicrobiota bacterium]